MLEIRDLHVRYGAIAAVRGVDLDIKSGEIVALIGANGAGKSTIARAVAGLLPFQGEIRYEGRALKPNSAEQNLRAGIALVPEGRGILARMTVEENLLMGLYCRRDRAVAMTELGKLQERFPILAERRDRMASLLSGGEQQMLAIARAIAADPVMVMLDEPSEGIMPVLVEEMFEYFLKLREQGTTILLVEQNVEIALGISDRAYIVDQGSIVHEGSARELLADSEIQEKYCSI